jgi:hypothetical protein
MRFTGRVKLQHLREHPHSLANLNQRNQGV